MSQYNDLQKLKIEKVIDKLKLEINAANSNDEIDQIVNRLQIEIDKAITDNSNLNKVKIDSKEEIKLYKDKINYKKEKEDNINSIIEEGNTKIDNSIDEDEIKIRVRQVKAKINAIVESGDINNYYIYLLIMSMSLYIMKKYRRKII